jgi:hypothetical protein
LGELFLELAVFVVGLKAKGLIGVAAGELKAVVAQKAAVFHI